MSKQGAPRFRAFLERERVPQADVVRGTGLSSGYISLLANDQTGATIDTARRILAYLSERLGRVVAFEELFGSTLPAADPAPAEATR